MDAKTDKRQQILDAALTLFSEKGYDGVGVDEIAVTAGIKGPTMYYYFKGKEALLDAMLETVTAYYDSHFGSTARLGKYPESMEELTAMSIQRLAFTIHDPQIRKVRRMMAMEQFRNDKIRRLTTLHHITGIEDMNTCFFEYLIAQGRVRAYDPRLLAFEFTAPVSMLVQMIDREPEREAEAMERIRQHMAHFTEVYGIPRDGKAERRKQNE